MCGPSSQAIQPLSLVFFVRHHPSSLSLVISSLGAPPFKESEGGPGAGGEAETHLSLHHGHAGPALPLFPLLC